MTRNDPKTVVKPSRLNGLLGYMGMDVITLSSGCDDSDSDVQIVGVSADTTTTTAAAPPPPPEDLLDPTETPLQIDQTEPRRSPNWLRKTKRHFKRHTTRAVYEVLDFVNGNTRHDDATKTLLPNGRDVDPKGDAVKPKSPCPSTDDSKHVSVCARQIDEIHLVAEWPNPPQSSLFSNNLELHELVQKYFGNIQSIPDDKLDSPEQSPSGSVTKDEMKNEMPHSAQEDPLGQWSPISEAASPTFPEKIRCFYGELKTKPLESNPSDSKQAFLGWTLKSEDLLGTDGSALNPRPYQSTVLQYPESLISSEPFRGTRSQAKETPIAVESTVRVSCKVEKDWGRSSSADNLCNGIPGDSVPEANSGGWYLPEAVYCIKEETPIGEEDVDSPVEDDWRDGSDVEEIYEERSFRSAGQEDRRYVCPVRLQKLMAQTAPDQDIDEEEEGGFGVAQVLCRQSLKLVYSTIEERHPEGTVQLLSDLLQPGFYPPKDITTHLLTGILLGPRCPLHLCVQAFDLLMRTQRHHRVDKTTIPWDWELLTSTMDDQEDPAKRHRCEVVRMLLEYVVRTMEEDFTAKLSPAALKQSIARGVLSCNCQFTKVRDVIKWLCAAIMKSTEEGGEGSGEADDHIRMVAVFQRMLRLALEVDCSPVLSSGRLSQELFHALLTVVPRRSHRKLLLDSLQSELLKCKLLQHLLDHSCTEKTPLPMSLGLLLHFLKHSTLSQEPTDGAQRWPKWEELIDLLWMILLSYNKVNKGDLRSPITEPRDRPMIATPNDAVSRQAVCEAVESLLSRSRADLGRALPDHIEESLSYLQDHLLDVCQP